MQRLIDFPIVGSYRADPIGKISSETSVNWYEADTPYGKKPKVLRRSPGLKTQTLVGSGPHRGALAYNNIAYFASNNQAFQMDPAYIVSPLSPPTFTTNTGFVRIVSNSTQIVFIDGVTGLLWDTVASTFSAITFPGGVIPGDITFMDGYFIVTNSANNRFYVSTLDTGVTWPATNFATINSSPTLIRGIARLKRRLFVFGETITEVWMDAGTANFPFRRDNNMLFEHGLEAKGSLVEGFDRLFYLSRDEGGVGSIKMVDGTLPQDISTYEVDRLIQSLTNTSQAVGLVYKIDGIIFYQITLGGKTLVYNVSMSSPGDRRWHEMEMIDGSRHVANSHIFFTNRHFVGAYNSNKLYDYSSDYFDNAGEAIHRLRICHVLNSPVYKFIKIHFLQVDMLQGVGLPGFENSSVVSLNANIDQDPFLFLSISHDGGYTYHSYGDHETFGMIGKTGQREWRTFWNNLGTHRDNIIKIETWNSVELCVLGASIGVEEVDQ